MKILEIPISIIVCIFFYLFLLSIHNNKKCYGLSVLLLLGQDHIEINISHKIINYLCKFELLNFTSCFKKRKVFFTTFFSGRLLFSSLFAILPDGKIKVWRVFSPTGATGAHHPRQKNSQLGRKLCELVSKSLDD